jgi:16S rRNA (adenine1518-N6/adenine1519-N6)-dimethyltransferase
VIRARKQFGQHFLEPAWVDKVIRAIAPQPNEHFIEIGPGAGAPTRPLAARVKQVDAFEIDRDLAADLRAATIPNLTIIEGDFLELADVTLRPPNEERRTAGEAFRTTGDERAAVRVAGNLPYNVASPILFKLAELYGRGLPLSDATVMLQREVADRLVAPPGSREYGVLSILVRHAADAEIVLKLPAGAFRPPPKVLSALVRLRFHGPEPPVLDGALFEGVVQAVFTRRRKTLANALLAFPPAVAATPARILDAAGIDGARRPETLAVAEFARLADALAGAR